MLQSLAKLPVSPKQKSFWKKYHAPSLCSYFSIWGRDQLRGIRQTHTESFKFQSIIRCTGGRAFNRGWHYNKANFTLLLPVKKNRIGKLSKFHMATHLFIVLYFKTLRRIISRLIFTTKCVLQCQCTRVVSIVIWKCSFRIIFLQHRIKTYTFQKTLRIS